MPPEGLTNYLLGYPADARLLIINADDFGMCHAVNQAIMGALDEGVVRSATVMTPCPWAWHAMRFLAARPEIPFGVHLTAIADWAEYPWGPLTPVSQVPTLVNEHGHFYNFDQMPAFLAGVDMDELATEFRAQIDAVLAFGLRPAHLDWHCLRLDGWDAVYDVMLSLAQEYGLALRAAYRSQMAKVQSLGLPANDRNFLDSYHVDPVTKAAEYAELLRRLPAGLSEWAVHPGLDTPELLTIEPQGNHIRQTDYDFLVSAEAKALIWQEGIILLDYRALQTVWREKGGETSR
ncbi:MAG: polysaccharide deacetylase family protein [Candidatus Promineofilum sp.]|nr:polysaccharide deacetylase family protein [Promineifilum sp.]